MIKTKVDFFFFVILISLHLLALILIRLVLHHSFVLFIIHYFLREDGTIPVYVGKSNSSRHPVWEASEKRGCELRRGNLMYSF